MVTPIKTFTSVSTMFMSIMSMSTMCMNGRGCVAFRGEEKDGTEEEDVMVTTINRVNIVQSASGRYEADI